MSYKPKTGTSSRRWLVVVCAAAAFFHVCLSAKSLPAVFATFERRSPMSRPVNRFDPEGLFPDHRPRFHRLEPNRELLALEQQLRDRNLLADPQILRWLGIANCGTERGRAFAVERLRQALQVYEVQAMRDPDPYRPYGPLSLLCQGDLHLMDQMDGVPWHISIDSLVLGALVSGAQGGGKSRAIVSICQQLVTAVPPRTVLIIDPKAQLFPYAARLNAVVLDGTNTAFDLAPPPGLDYDKWFRFLMPQLGSVIGLIQAVDILNTAGLIAIEQWSRLRQRDPHAEISLQDLYAALSFVPDTSRGRREGYADAARTALGRTIRGAGGMFTCRRGLDLREVFSQNVILDLRHLADPLSCRWLAQHLVAWKYQDARNKGENNRLETLIVIDDASRFLGAPTWPSHAAQDATPLSHMLAVLRSSGTGLMAATQLPASIDPGVSALAGLVLVVGGVHGRDHQQALAGLMGLNFEQQTALGRLRTRETVGFFSRGGYREPVHGWIPEVMDPMGGQP